MNINEKFRLNGGTSLSIVTGDGVYAYDGRSDIIMRMIEVLIIKHPIQKNFILKMDLIHVNELNEIIPDFVTEDSENEL